MRKTILVMKGIRKSFSGNEVLHGVDFDLREAETHTLMGENGSGKSTLMKILAGIYKADGGTITAPGSVITNDAIAMIHQELYPVLDMEISENIFAGREIRGKVGIFIDLPAMREKTKSLLQEFNLNISPKTKMRVLSVAQCQIIEIIKALSRSAKIIIMDEPTSAITGAEAASLFEHIRRLKANGVSVIYISHKMDEIFKISDRITVLRDGSMVGTDEAKNLNSAKLITLMVGRELSEVFPKRDVSLGEEILLVKNISYRKKVKNISFSLKEGEVLGIAGLVGAGRSELAETIFGARKKDSGDIIIKGKLRAIKNPREAVKHKIAMITEDRKVTGLNLGASLLHNISIAALRYFSKHGLINKNSELNCAVDFSSKLKIKSHGVNTQAVNLSGGNQQKVVLAKWLALRPDIIIMDEPTRGIDVGAKRDIYELITELAAQKKAVIMISSELPELIGMSDRIIVLCEGRVTAEFMRKDFNQENIMAAATNRSRVKNL